jgi:hypothetical protein
VNNAGVAGKGVVGAKILVRGRQQKASRFAGRGKYSQGTNFAGLLIYAMMKP